VDSRASAKACLKALFEAAVAAAAPVALVAGRLPAPPAGRTVVVGAGKAAAAMARAVEQAWRGPLSGLVVTPYGHGVVCARIEVVEAAHPVPDEAGREAAARIVAQVGGLTADDLVVCLISGGGSSLLALPAAGVGLEEEREVGAALLRSGAPIAEINCVRKHLSAVKGGRLAVAAWPAAVVTLIISDVPGDDPSVVASGPTVGDPTTYAQALAVLEKYGIEPPPAAAKHLRAGAVGGRDGPPETPKPGDPRLSRATAIVLATARDALAAAAAAAESWGLLPIVLGERIEGEAREVGRRHGEHALHLVGWQEGETAAAVLLSGGETTVTVRGNGRGGRNTEYLLGLALALEAHAGIYALAADTDGIDGSADNAGAFVAPDTLGRALAGGLDPVALLADNDAYALFERLDDLVVTGPTLTNVNDFRAIIVSGCDPVVARSGR
jgi:glycerate 2-kinase